MSIPNDYRNLADKVAGFERTATRPIPPPHCGQLAMELLKLADLATRWSASPWSTNRRGSTPMPNEQTPPADELFEVRAAIKHLTSRERELKATVIADPSARTGNHYAVEIMDVAVARMDVKELRAMHPKLAEEYTHTVFDKRVELRAVTDDGELVSLRRKPEKAI